MHMNSEVSCSSHADNYLRTVASDPHLSTSRIAGVRADEQWGGQFIGLIGTIHSPVRQVIQAHCSGNRRIYTRHGCCMESRGFPNACAFSTLKARSNQQV